MLFQIVIENVLKNKEARIKMTNETQTEKMIKTKWSKNKVPSCVNGKNHRWKDAVETAICLTCGYDVFDMQYKEVEQRGKD